MLRHGHVYACVNHFTVVSMTNLVKLRLRDDHSLPSPAGKEAQFTLMAGACTGRTRKPSSSRQHLVVCARSQVIVALVPHRFVHTLYTSSAPPA
jgi:hypothetical protein